MQTIKSKNSFNVENILKRILIKKIKFIIKIFIYNLMKKKFLIYIFLQIHRDNFFKLMVVLHWKFKK